MDVNQNALERSIKVIIREQKIQDSLARRISDKVALSETEIDELICLLGSHCQERTKRMLRYALSAVPDIRSYGIYGRVYITPRVEYCAGQSYPDEIRTVRSCLIGR